LSALPQELIRKKRDGLALAPGEIRVLVAGLTDGSLADAQVGALAMAIVLRGMTVEETVALTIAMRDSGTLLDWRDLPGPVLDKHSSGGVGDKVSLVLAPLVAACGGFVPMISGRGLGHTGGTLDKLESIPGYNATPGPEALRETMARAGCAIIGQTAELAPADRRLYAIRDVTGTVESLPLLTASILSKKLAAGLDGLVMDVKVGSGAFLPAADAARELAQRIVDVAHGAGLRARALLTDMDQCLGRTAGNALEVIEALEMLRNEPVEARFAEVTVSLAAELLLLGGLVASPEEALERIRAALGSGAAAERFALMVEAGGGPTDLLERPHRHLACAPVRLPAAPARPGFVRRIDTRALGLAVVGLGGGRRHPDHRIDPAVGLAEVVGIGEEVGRSRPLALVHAGSPEAAMEAARLLQQAFEITGDPVAPPPLVRGRIEARPSSATTAPR
jgi:thymidine phosphorylase